MKTRKKSNTNLYAWTVQSYAMDNPNYVKVKIGQSEDPKRRIAESQTYQPEIISTIATWKNLKKIKADTDVHRKLAAKGLKVKEGGQEFFTIPVSGDIYEERIDQVRKYIDAIVTELEGEKVRDRVILRAIQCEKINEALNIIKNAKKNTVSIVANLAPRFGKTIFGLSLFNELHRKNNIHTMIVPLYYLHNSFAVEIDRFSDFNDVVYIDADETNAEKKYNDAINSNKRAVIKISLNRSFDEWSQKHEWISKIPCDKKYTFCDEGDFGTWTQEQKKKIECITQENVENPEAPQVIISASGTNAQRLASITKQVDGVLYVSYSELEQTEDVIKRQFYMLNLDSIIKHVANVCDEHKPSWFKIWKKPYANLAILTEFIRSLVGRETLRPELNLSNITGEDIGCFIIMTNADKNGMKEAAEIFRKEIGDEWHIKVLNGDYTTNNKATAETKQEINEAKIAGKRGVIIITNQMGTRSYSVPEVQATVIAYDCGSVESTTQKLSRCLTPGLTYNGSEKKYGHIVDLSFDPNRSENLIGLLLDEIIHVKKSKGISHSDAIRYVLACINFFQIKFGTPVRVNENDMFNMLSNEDNLLRVADVTADVQSALGIIHELEKIHTNSSHNSRSKKKAISGVINSITENKNNKNNLSDKQKKNLEKMINQAVKSLNMSATSVYNLANDGETYRECIEIIKNDEAKANEFKELIGVRPSTVEVILDNGVLNENLLDLIVDISKNSIKCVFDDQVEEQE